jgi:hypothetical protein
MKIADAPYIQRAERFGDPDLTEKDLNSHRFKDETLKGLQNARDLLQAASRILEFMPEDTVWEDEILDLYDRAYDLAADADKLSGKVERW